MNSKTELKKVKDGYFLNIEFKDGKAVALLPLDETSKLELDGLQTLGNIVVQVKDKTNNVIATIDEKNGNRN